jgi:hypothetical protein
LVGNFSRMKLAPICIPTYIRLDHLKQTIGALQNNTLASESELFVFSDGPRPGHEAKVQAVRDYLKTIKGFKRVEIVERPINIFPENSRQGWRRLLDEYGRVILMEEDIVTAPAFLEYMNYMLDVYQDNPHILSISGYCPPFKLSESYPYDVYILPRFDAWGFATWKDRFDKIKMEIPSEVFRHIFLSPKHLYEFSKIGLELIPLTLNNYFNYRNGGDIRIIAQQFYMQMYTIYPVQHLVDNIGLDGSGVHPKKKNWFRVKLSQEPFHTPALPPDMTPNPEILKRHYEFRAGSYWNRFRQIGWTILTLLRKALRL